MKIKPFALLFVLPFLVQAAFAGNATLVYTFSADTKTEAPKLHQWAGGAIHQNPDPDKLGLELHITLIHSRLEFEDDSYLDTAKERLNQIDAKMKPGWKWVLDQLKPQAREDRAGASAAVASHPPKAIQVKLDPSAPILYEWDKLLKRIQADIMYECRVSHPDISRLSPLEARVSFQDPWSLPIDKPSQVAKIPHLVFREKYQGMIEVVQRHMYNMLKDLFEEDNQANSKEPKIVFSPFIEPYVSQIEKHKLIETASDLKKQIFQAGLDFSTLSDPVKQLIEAFKIARDQAKSKFIAHMTLMNWNLIDQKHPYESQEVPSINSSILNAECKGEEYFIEMRELLSKVGGKVTQKATHAGATAGTATSATNR